MNIINLIKNFKYIILINILILIVGIIIDYTNYTVKKDKIEQLRTSYISFFEINVESKFLKNYNIFFDKPTSESYQFSYINKNKITNLLNTLINNYIYEFTNNYGDEFFSQIEQLNHYDVGYSYILKYYDKSDNFDFSNKLLKEAQESYVKELIIEFVNDAKNIFFNRIDMKLSFNKYLRYIDRHNIITVNFKNYKVLKPYKNIQINLPITIILLMLLSLFNLIYFINTKQNK